MTQPDIATRFDTRAMVTLDGNGYGLIRISPAGEKWKIDRIHVRCSSSIDEARCLIYLGQVRADGVIDGTESGSTGDTTDTPVYLEDGQAIFVEWSGGDNGANAVVTLSGWKSNPLGGFRAVQ